MYNRNSLYWNKGDAKVKLLIFVIIVAIIVFLVMTVGGPYYAHYSLAETMDREIGRFNTWDGSAKSRPTEETVKANILKQAKMEEINLKDGELVLSKNEKGLIKGTLKYTRPLNFIVYEYDLDFEHVYDPKELAGKKVTKVF